jgi:hypothetical protein
MFEGQIILILYMVKSFHVPMIFSSFDSETIPQIENLPHISSFRMVQIENLPQIFRISQLFSIFFWGATLW